MAARPAPRPASRPASQPANQHCASSGPPQIAGNAFYCPQEDGIVFDSAALVPVLLGKYGPAALAVAFAHEFAHSVQARIGPTPADRRADPTRYPSILIEAQADCDAGAFLAWAIAGDSARVRVPPASALRAITPVLDFRDPVTLSPTDPTAHGLGLDRLTFLLRGYRGGADACHALTMDDLELTLGRAVTGTPSSRPRFAATDQALAAASASVAAFAAVRAAAGFRRARARPGRPAGRAALRAVRRGDRGGARRRPGHHRNRHRRSMFHRRLGGVGVRDGGARSARFVAWGCRRGAGSGPQPARCDVRAGGRLCRRIPSGHGVSGCARDGSRPVAAGLVAAGLSTAPRPTPDAP